MKKIITRLQARELISNLKNGTIYSVKFIKKDGTERLLNSIKGTSRGVKGVGLKFDAEERNLIPVYDIQLAKKDPKNPDKCWRMVNVETLLEVSVNHQTFQVEG